MIDGFGLAGWLGLAVFGVAALGLAALLYRVRQRGSRENSRVEEVLATHGRRRLELVERTDVDPERRLILVRCDEIEHLIMIGGPADLVVENDVRRRRSTAARPPGKPVAAEQARPEPPGDDAQARPAREPASAEAPSVAALETKPMRIERPGPSPAPAIRQTAAAEAPAVQPARRDGQAASSTGGDGEASRPRAAGGLMGLNPRALLRQEKRRAREQAAPRSTEAGKPRAEAEQRRADQSQPAPRAAAPPAQPAAASAPAQPAMAAPAQSTAAAPAPPDARLRLQRVVSGRRESDAAERRAGPQREAASRPGEAPLAESSPAADVPGMAADSIENEIVRALRVEPQAPLAAAPRPAASAREPAGAVKRASDPATTLGDLADRLEEALAREVQAANSGHGRLDLDLGAFGFDREPDSREKAGASPTAAERERPEPPRTTANPEPEPRRDLRATADRPERQERSERQERPERQEETPVISLNARRREPVDPLEDEMARLLGELTGDTTRR